MSSNLLNFAVADPSEKAKESAKPEPLLRLKKEQRRWIANTSKLTLLRLRVLQLLSSDLSPNFLFVREQQSKLQS
jgi:hypothetical protein